MFFVVTANLLITFCGLYSNKNIYIHRLNMTNGGNHMTNSYSHASGDSHPSRNGCGSLAHNDLDRAHVGLGTTTVPPRQREDGDLHVGLGTTTMVPRQREDGGLHVMDLEEEENELLKQALEESTRLQVMSL